MWNKFRFWYLSNHVEISWFLTGSLTAFGIVDLQQGDYVMAFVSFVLAWSNFLFKFKN